MTRPQTATPPADTGANAATSARTVPFREALRFWLKLGFVSFGGPAGQIAIMHQELVERRGWISERRFLHALNFCMVLPGPEATQLATYIGWLMHGTRGGIVAGVLFVLPSLFLLVALSWIYLVLGSTPVVAGVLHGVKPAVVAVVVFAAYRIGSRALRDPAMWGLAAAAFLAMLVLDMSFPWIVACAAVAGYVGGRVAPERFVPPAAGAAAASHGPVLDSHVATGHVSFSRRRLLKVCLVALACWALPLAMIAQYSAAQRPLLEMALFFTRSALVTFGGAYAVLPYVYQAGVEEHHWVTASQMIDGLALGETTPGPLIMIVSFVGFVGGWTTRLFGPDAPFLAGVAGALVATYFTFLPSFLFILAGGPLVEATHGQARFTAPLAGITAAVVGVVLNLAVFFARHVMWPAGLAGPFDWPAAAIALVALIALWRFRIGIIPVILACGALGWALRAA